MDCQSDCYLSLLIDLCSWMAFLARVKIVNAAKTMRGANTTGMTAAAAGERAAAKVHRPVVAPATAPVVAAFVTTRCAHSVALISPFR